MAWTDEGKFYMSEQDYDTLRQAVNVVVSYTHLAALRGGWWTNVDWSNPYVQATKVGLIAGEAHEAIEGIRKDCQDDHLPQYKAVYTELIDVLVRDGDTLGRYMQDDSELDPGQILVDKMRYNAQRQDHNPENRKKVGGKRF